jgi:hypothetical protein
MDPLVMGGQPHGTNVTIYLTPWELVREEATSCGKS